MIYGMKDIALELAGRSKNIHLRRQEFLAVNHVSLKVRRGECLGLIGHNGAGKTTLLKMINGLFPPDAGGITVRGRVGALIALGAGFNPVLSGRENIFINAAVLGLPRNLVKKRFDEIVGFAELEKFIDSPVQSYSSGMQARLGFAVAAHLDPDILLVDEILSVGDVAFQARCFNRMGEVKKQGAAIVFVSHNMHHVGRFCDKALYLRKGTPITFGPVQDALNDYFKDQREHIAKHNDGAGPTGELATGDELQICDVRFVNPTSGLELKLGNPLESMVVELSYKIFSEKPLPAILDILIQDKDGILFQGTNSNFNTQLEFEPTLGKVIVGFSDIRSQNDVLEFAFAIWNLERTKLLSWRRGYRIPMDGTPLSSGRSMFNVKWEIHRTG